MVNRRMKRRQASLTTREMQTHTSDSRPEAEGAARVCGGALRGCRLTGTVSGLQSEQSSGHRWWGPLYGNVNALHTLFDHSVRMLSLMSAH